MLNDTLTRFGIDADAYEIQKLSSGLINHTWKVSGADQEFVLQQINTNVFKSPQDIAQNIAKIAAFLSANVPDYLFISPIPAKNGEYLVTNETGEVFRLMPYVKNSQTLQAVNSRNEAFEAARQFGKFTSILAGYDTAGLRYTLADFHNLDLRFSQFQHACNTSTEELLSLAKEEIKQALAHQDIVETYRSILEDNTIPRRVIHHDTKISNVLFDVSHRGLCVIDLDTVMPGYFFSDVGDMMRTYLSPANEEETDLCKVVVREDFFRAVIEGYCSEMGRMLTAAEKDLLIYSGNFMIYMQAIRFLTDFLNGDVYYPTTYPQHNLIRAKNQFTLLNSYRAAETNFSGILDEVFAVEAKSQNGSLP